MIKDRIDKYMRDHLDEMIEDTKVLVSYSSTEDNPSAVSKSLDFVLSRARNMKMKVMETSKKDVGIVEIGNGDITVGILVHVDVVGTGDIGKWQYPPYELTMSNDKLVGRGITDDKGPVIMSLYAMKALLDLEVKLNKKIWLIIGTSEESEWTDMETFKREFPMPDFGYSPDGNFPIYNNEKGYVDVELKFPILKEHNIEHLHSGDSPNTIPSAAKVKFTDGHLIEENGRSSHSSAPELGENAILKLCADPNRLKGMGFADFIGNHCDGEDLARLLELDHVSSPTGTSSEEKTTAVPTILRKDEDSLFMNINIRQMYGITRRRIEKIFDSLSQKYGFTYRIVQYMDAMEVDREQPFLEIMSETMKAYNQNGDFRTAAGSSYAKSMKNFVSWGPVFPYDEDTAHIENESLPVKSFLLASQIYAYYLAALMHKS